METTIVHLSDLHLGNDFVWRSLMRGRTWWNAEDPKIVGGLAEALRALVPDYIVMSGDIVNKCSPSTFDGAVKTLQDFNDFRSEEHTSELQSR